MIITDEQRNTVVQCILQATHHVPFRQVNEVLLMLNSLPAEKEQKGKDRQGEE